jgi:hypothetical protein
VKDGALSCEFPQILGTVLYEIIIGSLGYHKFCVRCSPKMLTGAHKTQKMASDLPFLERNDKVGNEFVNHNVTGDETRVLCVNVETKEHSPNKPK